MSPFIVHFRVAVRSRVILVIFFAVMLCWIGACHDGDRGGAAGGVDGVGESGRGRKGPLALLKQGLEYRRYVIAGNHDLFVQELGSYAVNLSVDEDPFVNLEANGFRFFLIPVDKVEGILSSLNPEPIHDSTWLGLVSGWIPIAAGPSVVGTRILKIDNQQISYNEGQFRFLVRTYPVNMSQDVVTPSLRVELLPQWHHSLPMGNLLPINPQDRELSGQIFTEMGGAVNLDGKMALLILGDDPANSWSDTEGDGGDSTQLSSSEAVNESVVGGVDAGRTTNDDQTQGPNTMAIKTIGEEVLNSTRDFQQMILVFIPHLAQQGGNYQIPREK